MPTPRFYECKPTPWEGRYARIPGDCSVFHLWSVDGRPWPVMLWDTDQGRGTCKAVNCDAAARLAHGVQRAKRYAGGTGRGSFLINENGQVVVSSSGGSGKCFHAGYMDGTLLFENPFRPGEPIDLGDAKGLRPGDPWTLPYVGMPYNLHRSGFVYFYKQHDSGGSSVYPPQQDPQLVRGLRLVRPRGPVRFIVNPAGLVLTKRTLSDRQCSEEFWQPVYVGSISRDLWFAKE
jgi:hypothetical protein